MKRRHVFLLFIGTVALLVGINFVQYMRYVDSYYSQSLGCDRVGFPFPFLGGFSTDTGWLECGSAEVAYDGLFIDIVVWIWGGIAVSLLGILVGSVLRASRQKAKRSSQST
jgi:hypothetical protein